MDLSKFFDRVQHDVLMARLARRIDDKMLLRLIGRYLRAGVMVEGVLQPTDVGTPQGGPASPLLANILLDDLDKELERRGLHFVRYADDFAIFAKSQRSAERIMASVTRYLPDSTYNLSMSFRLNARSMSLIFVSSLYSSEDEQAFI